MDTRQAGKTRTSASKSPIIDIDGVVVNPITRGQGNEAVSKESTQASQYNLYVYLYLYFMEKGKQLNKFKSTRRNTRIGTSNGLGEGKKTPNPASKAVRQSKSV